MLDWVLLEGGRRRVTVKVVVYSREYMYWLDDGCVATTVDRNVGLISVFVESP